jgi:hypothetical protein
MPDPSDLRDFPEGEILSIRPSGSDCDQTWTFTASGLPDGLSINPDTGVISAVAVIQPPPDDPDNPLIVPRLPDDPTPPPGPPKVP